MNQEQLKICKKYFELISVGYLEYLRADPNLEPDSKRIRSETVYALRDILDTIVIWEELGK